MGRHICGIQKPRSFSGELDAEKIVEYGLIFVILIKKKNIER